MKKYIFPAVVFAEFSGKDIVTVSPANQDPFEFSPEPGFGDTVKF